LNTPAWLTAVVETALARYLSLDPEVAARLAPLSGKVLEVELRGLDLHFYLIPAGNRIQVQGHYEGVPDASLRGAPLSLARLALSEQGRRALFSGAVQMEGDTELGQQLQDILNAVDIDWEEQLARLTGDVVAHQAGNATRNAQRWLGKAGESLTLDLADYLHEEGRQVPARGEVERFVADVDSLRSDIERLAARVKRLTDKG
jgi:ubiquinone biosynthesis accessory factor UbiJ